MILLKIILSSSVFILLYKIVLENDRMHKFKRFYLLTTLLLSFVIPFISIKVVEEKPVVVERFVEYIPVFTEAKSVANENPFDFWKLFYLISGLVTLVLLARIMRNLITIIKTARDNPKTKYKESEVVLLPNSVSPYSFYKYIFISKSDFEKGGIEDVMAHEQAHIRQFHTFDLLLIEILKAFMWFNPALYYYKKAILLNHEFLADESVIQSSDIVTYQHIILDFASKPYSLELSNSLNYSITKKRFIMMTRKKSGIRNVMKSILVAGICLIAVVLFGEKSSAQSEVVTKPSTGERQGATQEEAEWYYKQIEKYTNKAGDLILKNMPEGEKKKLIYISNKMTSEQLFVKEEATMFFSGKVKKTSISDYDYQKWIENMNYTLYIDTKKVSNKTLRKFKPQDFQHYFLSEGRGENKYTVNLTTASFSGKRLEETKDKISAVVKINAYRMEID